MAKFERFESNNIVECRCPDKYCGEWRAVLETTDAGDYQVTAVPHGPGSDCGSDENATRHYESRSFLTYEMALAWLEGFCGINTERGDS